MNAVRGSSKMIVVGAGLSGSEAALSLASWGYQVKIYEQKPKNFSAAHKLSGAAELVCSNSFKSVELSSAHGLLKEELRQLNSPLLASAWDARLPGGKALTIEREKFSELVTERLKSHPLIEFVSEEVTMIPESEGPVLIAAGPLASDSLIQSVKNFLNEDGLYFYDATSPVVELESLDFSRFFWASRNQESKDYLNLALNREEYDRFRENVLAAEKVVSHIEGEELKFFEGCLPIEVLAERGAETLACSCMSPSGFGELCPPDTFAVIQFRRERAAGELLSMVGFQTRMKWPEQERVFRMLPGMQNANFVRLGAMHRNTFLNAPKHLTDRLESKARPGLYFAGQLTGSEGYTEALATGHYAAMMMVGAENLPEVTAIRSLARYLHQSDPANFQPMNFNFGLLPPLSAAQGKIKGARRKQMRNLLRSEIALAGLSEWLKLHPQFGATGLSDFSKVAL